MPDVPDYRVQLLEQILETSPIGIAVVDRGRNIVYANGQLPQMIGLSREEILERGARPEAWDATDHEGNPVEPSGFLLQRIFTTGEPVLDYRLALPTEEGQSRYLLLSAAPLIDENGEVGSVLVSLLDVSGMVTEQREREALEEELREALKMEAVGRLAGGIAHDFNNYLAAISGNAEIGLFKTDEDAPARKYFEKIVGIVKEAEKLSNKLSAFTRQQIVSPVRLDLNEAILGMEEMVRRTAGRHVGLTLRLEADPAITRIDPIQLQRVVANLLANATEAMPEGGEVELATGTAELDEAAVRAYRKARPGSFVYLEVTDTGTGMTEEVLQKAFEPFFSTKEDRAGLGLATVYGIAERNCGGVEMENRPGSGTRVRVYLPAAGAPPESEEAPAPADRAHAAAEPQPASAAAHAGPDAPPTEAGSTRILVVEDEELVRELLVEILEAEGYAIVACDGPEAALEAFEQHGTFDLVITDMTMPGSSGAEMAGDLTARDADLRFLFISGHTPDETFREGVMLDEIDFLAKPFSAAELLESVRKILARPGPREADS